MDERTRWSSHADSPSQTFLRALLPTLVLFLIAPVASDAQVPVTTSITHTSGEGDLGTLVSLPLDNVYDITGGMRPGDGPNLFHSFGDFTVGVGDTANFLNTTPTIITSNILARVTGGNPSSLFGTIDTLSYPGANLFLVNPFGIVFGPNASLNVGGSVSFTTAQYIRLFDGLNSVNFFADPASVFVMDPVTSFGFLPAAYGFLTTPDPSAAITVHGRALSVSSGQSISLIGGTVAIQGDTLPGGTIQQPAQLSAPMGRIHLASTASPGEFAAPPGESLANATTIQSVPNNPVDPASAAVSFTSFGSVSLALGSSIGSGTSIVFIKDGQIVLSVNDATLTTSDTSVNPAPPDAISLNQGSSIVTSNSGAEPGADVQITVGDLSLNGSAITTTTEASGYGHGGNITANVGTLSMANGAVIQSENTSVGTDLDGDGVLDIAGIGGNVTVQGLEGPGTAANLVTLDTFAQIKTEALFGLGRGGDVSITTDKVLLDNTSEVFTNTFVGDSVGGNLVLNVGTLTLKGGSAIRTAELTFGTGQDLDLNGDGVVDTGSGGHVTIQGITGSGSVADSVVLSGGSQIKSDSGGFGDGGGLSITATSLNVDGASTLNSRTDGIGRGGDIVVSVQNASFSDEASIVSHSAALGAGGTITVQGLDGDRSKADALSLSGFVSRILSESEGSGLPGKIEVYAKTVSLADRASIEAGTRDSNGTGGKVTIVADSVGIAGGSFISSQAFAQSADTVAITADQLNMDNGSIVTATASVFGGRGGDVVLNVGRVSLANGATVNSSTTGTGRAGDVSMNVGTLTLTSNAEVSSNSAATASGNAGIVTIQGQGGPGTAAMSVTLTDSSLLTNTEGTGAGGEIQIRAGQLQLDGLALLTAETSGTGKAGSIAINSDNLSVTGGARIEASTTGVGDAGDIVITNTGTVSVTGLSSNGSSRSGIFAKTQTSGGTAGAGTGGGSGGSGSGGSSSGGSSGGGSGGGGSGSGGGGQTATAGNAGNIGITTNNLLLSGGAQIDSSTTSGGAGGSVSITTAENITIVGSSTRLKSDATRGDGNGGNITLVAKNITVREGASVTAATGGRGDAGNVTLTTLDQLLLQSAGTITTSTSGSGNGGTITIQAGQIVLDGPGTGITADTLRPFADLTITINILHSNDGDLVVQLDTPTGTRVALLSRVGGTGDNFTDTKFNDQATKPITSGTAPFTGTFKPREPLGQIINELTAGNWTLNVQDKATGNVGSLQNWTLQIGQQTFQSTGASSPIPDGGFVQSTIAVANPTAPTVPGVGEASGKGGNVTIDAGTVTVQNGATMSATTRGSGQGGTLTVNATGPVALTGFGSGLFTDSEASGIGGNLNVRAGQMTMSSGASVSAASSGTGDAGQVLLTTPTLNADDASITTSTSGSGNAGGITANVGTVNLTNGSTVSSNSTGTLSGAGDAGSVTIAATGNFMSNAGTVSTSAENAKGGDILIDAQGVALSNGTVISANSNAPFSDDGAGNAGNIRINSASNFIMQNSSVTTEASLASGGRITINTPELFRLTNSQIVTSVAGSGTDTSGGDITIDPNFVILQNSSFLFAQAFAGTGGNINIISNVFLQDPNSLVDASSQLGISGTVNIQSPVQNVSGELVVLSQDFSSAAALLAQQCAARVADGTFSTFVVAAREGLPVEPGGFLASPSFLTELGGPVLSGQPPQALRSAVERSFPEYDAKPLQLAKLGNGCNR